MDKESSTVETHHLPLYDSNSASVVANRKVLPSNAHIMVALPHAPSSLGRNVSVYKYIHGLMNHKPHLNILNEVNKRFTALCYIDV